MTDILLERNGAVATITLNRPAARNRLSKSMIEAVIADCEIVAADDDVRVVIVQAMGPDFSTGVDLADPELAAIAREPVGARRRQLLLGPRLMQSIQALPQTTIVAMQGYCLGGGACIALACDLRVASADLRFGLPEIKRGMTMSWQSIPLMVAHFGPTRTKELLITGRLLDGEAAMAWGLVNRTTTSGVEAVQAEAAAWASELAATVPPIVASMTKETVNAVANANTAIVHMDRDQFILSQMTEDFREGVEAFLEKRRPSYKGR